MIKRLLAALIVVIMTSAVLVMSNGDSEAAPNFNLTLTISPKQGGVGTRIATSVPPSQAQSVCLDTAEATAQLQSFASQTLLSTPDPCCRTQQGSSARRVGRPV